MNSNQIVSRMNTYLHTSASELAQWLEKFLSRTSPDWWEDSVIGNLSYHQRELATENGFTKLSDFDLAALLRIADKSWYTLRTVAYLPTHEREVIRAMMGVRNNWAHCSADLPGKDTIVSDLSTLHEFLTQLGCDEKLLNEIDRMIDDVKSPSTVDFASISNDQTDGKNADTDIAIVSNGNIDIAENSIVYLVGNPNVKGIVMSVSDVGGTKKYNVFVDGSIKTFYSGQIAPFINEVSYNWVDVNTFRSTLTAYQINNPSGRSLYSLNSARIDFVPYQFRPALKLIHSDEPRILIADSVGVGKTIEAGLIIKELQARHDLEKALIICPKPLVAERKWELEMKRFDEDFIPVDGATLRQIVSDTDRDGEWSIRYNKAIIPYSILDGRTYNGEHSKKSKSFGLKDLDPAPHFDLVIVDEAHHIRNGSMEKEKAYEYKCVKYFCDHADAVVMLTATPLQTSDDDLYTLLNVLRPDVVIDKATFSMMSRPNANISHCSKIMRRAGDNWQQNALDELENLLDTQWGENVIATNPAYISAVKTLRQEKISREERVELISKVESLNSFNTMLSRTRRKDIQDFCIRRPYTLSVNFTPEQQELHDELLRFEHNALLHLHGSARSVPFMMSTIKRQAASCIFGLAPHIRDIVDRRFSQIDDDPDTEYEALSFGSKDYGTLKELSERLLQLADNLSDDDPKFDLMMSAIQEKQKQENNKIIIFSTFRYTLSYLCKKLAATGLRVAQIDGSVKDDVRCELRDRFQLPKEDKDAIDILLFTEVGSEGLDYQFCDMMINYDLPWNPMRIEQRIGRIDRRGQQSETVSIYNMITEGTVDADIYYRCLMRIGVFENSIGECEKILGDIATQLDQIATDSSLTEQERRTKIEQMTDNEIRNIQELNNLEEEEKDLFGFDLSEYTTAQEIRNAENPWLTQSYLQIMIEQYLSERTGQNSSVFGEGAVKQLRLSAEARAVLREDFKKLPESKNAVRRSWDIYLKGSNQYHAITFDSDAAEHNKDAFFITAMHPLAKQAAAYYKTNEQSYIHLQYTSDNLPVGKYYFSVYAWSYVGLNPHFKLVVVCNNDSIAKELPDILQEAQNCTNKLKIQPSDWDSLEQKHIALWTSAKSEALKDAQNLSKYKIESLTNNFTARQRSLNQKIKDTADDKLKRMYLSQLESATNNFEEKIRDINDKSATTDILTTAIANGILEIGY